jgi:AraC family transcriptional regulator of adaptative response / DNA-3-methyladenine glycosylase II
MRALSDPDAFLPADVGVLSALAGLGAVPPGAGAARAGAARAGAARAAAALADGWRPWRSYAVHHLWALLERGATEVPDQEGRS